MGVHNKVKITHVQMAVPVTICVNDYLNPLNIFINVDVLKGSNFHQTIGIVKEPAQKENIGTRYQLGVRRSIHSVIQSTIHFYLKSMHRDMQTLEELEEDMI